MKRPISQFEMNSLFYFLRLLFVFIFSIQLLWADESEIFKPNAFDEAFVKKAIEHADALYKACPPSRCFIVNYGVPTAMTSARFRALINDPEAEKRYYRELMFRGMNDVDMSKPAQKRAMFRILDLTIPSDEVLAGRPVVIHRILSSGVTLQNFARALALYQKEMRPSLKLGLYTVSAEEKVRPDILQDFRALNFKPFIMVDDPHFAHQMQIYNDWFNRHEFEMMARFAETLPSDWAQLQRGVHNNLSIPNPHPMELEDLKFAKPTPTAEAHRSLLSRCRQALSTLKPW